MLVRDCPKAYHPACVKRDESFFRRSIRWNCGMFLWLCLLLSSNFALHLIGSGSFTACLVEFVILSFRTVTRKFLGVDIG